MNSIDDITIQGKAAIVSDNAAKPDNNNESKDANAKRVGRLNVANVRGVKAFLSADGFTQSVEKQTDGSIDQRRGRSVSRRRGPHMGASASERPHYKYYCSYGGGNTCNEEVSKQNFLCTSHWAEKKGAPSSLQDVVHNRPVSQQFTCAYRFGVTCTETVAKHGHCCPHHFAMIQARRAERQAVSTPSSQQLEILAEMKELKRALEDAMGKVEKAVEQTVEKAVEKAVSKVAPPPPSSRSPPPPPQQPTVVVFVLDKDTACNILGGITAQKKLPPPTPAPIVSLSVSG